MKAARGCAAFLFGPRGYGKTKHSMSDRTIMTILVIAFLVLGLAMLFVGSYIAIAGTKSRDAAELMTAFHIFTIKSSGGPLGFAFAGVALEILSLLAARVLPR